ncbi:hypothetical protein BJ508DRAFT_310415 [Ascobolus immersus RN42]|uniref:Uncharacterized protein n=1 Tax=Ascobolus immersus RN42 TaxID=1160509 RepID=A0A3N4HVM4_ASCIM|nr:hypothetical protein BJ508DRAFT_310415 [Ascobolus immersus RN42]
MYKYGWFNARGFSNMKLLRVPLTSIEEGPARSKASGLMGMISQREAFDTLRTVSSREREQSMENFEFGPGTRPVKTRLDATCGNCLSIRNVVKRLTRKRQSIIQLHSSVDSSVSEPNKLLYVKRRLNFDQCTEARGEHNCLVRLVASNSPTSPG